ncbi:hypothetical protein FRB99_000913, partial [Tulasnella sp. 403]
MKSFRLSTISLAAIIPLSVHAIPDIPPELYSTLIPQRLLTTAQNISNPLTYPEWTKIAPYGNQLGQWQYFNINTWTSGFFPASLMLLAERGQTCPDGQIIAAQDAQASLNFGRVWSAPLTTLETNNSVKHDVGFISFPFWEDLKMNPGNTTAQAIVNAFAAYLAGRYNPIVGCTRSWDTPDPTQFEVIIDNMINIELFFVSAALNGNQTYIEMAKSHADHTMQNHVRDDGSTYHVVVYNSTTGAVIARETSQGYANERQVYCTLAPPSADSVLCSTWTRGQAWGMYGFTSMFNRTGDQKYLDTARRLSTFYVNNLPKDNLVPPWDFNAPASPDRPRDTSSATIASSAMLFLSQMETRAGNSTGSSFWLNAAISLLRDTVSLAYRRETNWQAILSNGTANNPQQNNNTGLVYGDYYFIKAGNMLLDMGVANCSSGTGPMTLPYNGTASSTTITKPSGASTTLI